MADQKGAHLRTQPSEEKNKQAELMDQIQEAIGRSEELVTDKQLEGAAISLYRDVEKGFSDQWERSNDAQDWWDIYHCQLGPKQFYSGNSKVFVPIVADAVDARKVRFSNQVFPVSGKNVEVITSENKPQDLMSLLEFYIRKCRLRTDIIPPLLINGDIEGQYNVYMRWERNERNVVWKVRQQADEAAMQGMDLDIEDEDFYDIKEDQIVHQYPVVEVLADADVLVLPFTAVNIEGALASGGSATIIRRWSKAKIEQLIDEGEIYQPNSDDLVEQLNIKAEPENPNKEKKSVDAAGIKTLGGKTFALVYETWTVLNVRGERRLCRIYFAGERLILSIKLNPYWCDLCPLLSASVNKIQGSFKGQSLIKKVDTMQYAANDAINEAMDSAHYSLQPIVLTDPLKNPRTTTMILNTSAIWETSPQDTQFAQFPKLWTDGFEIVKQFTGLIFQRLSVNPAMIPQMPQAKGGKTNQAQVAQEQQVDILTTADAVTNLEGGILTPILRWFVYLDHQFRDEKLMVRQFGLEGKRMSMDAIEPVQFDRRFEIKWFGVEAARSAQQMQLQMAGLNMVGQIPPDKLPGFQLNMVPVVQQFLENLFGPRQAAEVFQDQRRRFSLDAEFENTLLEANFQVPVQMMDEDQQHLQVHAKLMQQTGDPSGHIREHMMMHQMQMQKKQQAMAMQAMAQAMSQQGGQQPGQQGPRRGAMPGQKRGGQQPPGAIHQDQLRDPGAMPRPRIGGV
jgi:hypothetical protein